MNGFAGSERAGERRRRRLAVESDGAESASANQSGAESPAARSTFAPRADGSPLLPGDCPIAAVISVHAWKHWLVIAVGVSLVSGLLYAGLTWPDWATSYGPGLTRLLKSTSSPVIRWIYTLALFVTAQGACLILWARSRSLGDFHGNYRIWGWAAATWLGFSFAIATNAHLLWSQTLLHYIHWKSPGAPLWCWLLPALAWGLGIALRLEPELRNDRSGYWLFLLSGIFYLGVAATLGQSQFFPQALTEDQSQLALVACQLLGHATLLLSTTLHARFVMFFSAEPPPAPSKKRSSKKVAPVVEEPAAAVPKVGWMSSLFKRLTADGPDETSEESADEGAAKKGRKRAPAKKRVSRKPARAAQDVEEESSGWEESDSASPQVDGTDQDAETPSGSDEDQSASTSDRRYRIDEANSDSSDQEPDELKGLSKRERRRLQQQAREEDRHSRR